LWTRASMSLAPRYAALPALEQLIGGAGGVFGVD
jgi:hypothetical protein